mmetsp:Transcript_451/g.925  ORF Transcript_451/g.925 Transcript_451/m.925 type:complete len:241 (+) Transcript_451:41-763(+)
MVGFRFIRQRRMRCKPRRHLWNSRRRQPPEGRRQPEFVSDVARENNNGYLGKTGVVGGAPHDAAARQDLAQDPRGFQAQAVAQDVVARDSPLADQKTQVGREVPDDVHEKARDGFPEPQPLPLVRKAGQLGAAGVDDGGLSGGADLPDPGQCLAEHGGLFLLADPLDLHLHPPDGGFLQKLSQLQACFFHVGPDQDGTGPGVLHVPAHARGGNRLGGQHRQGRQDGSTAPKQKPLGTIAA